MAAVITQYVAFTGIVREVDANYGQGEVALSCRWVFIADRSASFVLLCLVGLLVEARVILYEPIDLSTLVGVAARRGKFTVTGTTLHQKGAPCQSKQQVGSTKAI